MFGRKKRQTCPLKVTVWEVPVASPYVRWRWTLRATHRDDGDHARAIRHTTVTTAGWGATEAKVTAEALENLARAKELVRGFELNRQARRRSRTYC